MYSEVKLDQVYNLLKEVKKTHCLINTLAADIDKDKSFGINIDGESLHGIGKYHDDPGFAPHLLNALISYQHACLLEKLKEFGLFLTPDRKDKK